MFKDNVAIGIWWILFVYGKDHHSSIQQAHNLNTITSLVKYMHSIFIAFVPLAKRSFHAHLHSRT